MGADCTPPQVAVRSQGRVSIDHSGVNYTVYLLFGARQIEACSFSTVVYGVGGAQVLARDAAHSLATSVADGMIR